MPTSLAQPAHTPIAPQPHFAGSGSLAQRMGSGTIKLFDAINKEYLYEFFALDIVALWITRIVTGLIVGRLTYNSLNQPNPAAKADTPFELWRKDVSANIKGLNWGNAWEILRREALTGPGCLLLPSLAYGITRQITKNHTQQMNYGWFQKLHLAFQAGASAASSVPEGAATAHQLIKNTVGQFFSPMTAGDELDTLRKIQLTDSTMLRQMPRSHISLDVADTRTLSNVLSTYGSSAPQTVGDFLDAWAHRYATRVESIVKDHSTDRSKARKALSELADTLGNDLDAVMRGVTRHNNNAFKHVIHEGLMPLRELASATPLFKPQTALTLKAAIHTKGVSIETFTKNLGQFADYWLDVLPKASAKTTLPQLLTSASQYANKLTRIKGLTTAVGLAIGGTWLYFLPRFIQDGKSYPAARLFHQAGLATPNANSMLLSNDALQRLSTNPTLNPLWQLSRSAPMANRGGMTL